MNINRPSAIRTTGTGETSTFRVKMTDSGWEQPLVTYPAKLLDNVGIRRVEGGREGHKHNHTLACLREKAYAIVKPHDHWTGLLFAVNVNLIIIHIYSGANMNSGPWFLPSCCIITAVIVKPKLEKAFVNHVDDGLGMSKLLTLDY